MGIETVAVHSDADANAPHVREATVAWALGGNTSAESYLRVDKLLEAARATGADAVHPGYGFLSEDAGFAQAVQDAGLTWIGPPPAAIRALGDKAAAKALGLADRGILRTGLRADFVAWNLGHPAELCYWLGGRFARGVYASGVRLA